MSEPQKNLPLAGHGLALLTTLIWGLTFISTKVLLRSFTPTEILLIRFVLGYIVLKLLRPHMLHLENLQQEFLYAMCGLTGVTLYYLLENYALYNTLASNVGILVSTAPLMTVLLSFVLSGGKMPLRQTFLIGLVIAFSGILVINLNGAKLQLNPKGDFLTLGAAFSWAVYSILLNKVNGLHHPTLLNTQRIFFWGILFMIPFAAANGFSPDPALLIQPVNLLNLLFLSVLACAVCYVMWNRAANILGSVRINVYIYLDPVISVVASALILGEPVTKLSVLGTCLILSGLVISNLRAEPSSEKSR